MLNDFSGADKVVYRLGKALHYLLEQWPYLLRYLEDSRLELSNNRAERSIKPFVMGGKPSVCKHPLAGARSSAVIYSLIETAKENCIRRSKRAAKPRMMVHRHRVNGAAVPDVWCTAAVGMVHTAAARFHYSGIPLRLRMDSPSIWMV